MIINKYCSCGAYVGEQDTKGLKISYDRDAIYKDKDQCFRCKVCNKSV